VKPVIVITGCVGFIGTNFVRNIIDQYPQYRFVGIDKIVAPYNRDNIYLHDRYKFYLGDIADEMFIDNVFAIEKPTYVINMGAESHVCSSIGSAIPFVKSNILGVQVLIDASLKYQVSKFLQVSTDEVMGQLTSKHERPWTEEDCPSPRNPYSATKYAAEILIFAANQTHKLTYNITRCCNNYGKFQPPRNLLPRIFMSIIDNQPIPIHGDGSNMREWIGALDHCSAIMTVLEKGVDNNIYNVGSGIEFSNLEMVYKIANILDKKPKIEFGEQRKGHDWRYFLNCDKIKQLGWKPKIDFDQGLKECAKWYIDNKWRYQ
jgi:dTDP-glucose 4,6-dehydratase